MTIETSLTGGFPRTRTLANAIRRREKGRISEEQFEELVYKETLRTLVRAAGYLDILTDGMFLCDDILNPFIKDIEGVKRGWLVRFYDNNFFVRNPIVRDKIRLSESPVSLMARINLVKNISQELPGKKYRIPLPGPLTFVDFAVIEGKAYSSKRDLALDYVDNVLLPAVDLISKEGHVAEIHEPSLGSETVSSIGWESILERLGEAGGEMHVIQYFNRPPKQALRILAKDNLVGVDLVENPDFYDIIPEILEGRRLQAGVVDARNTRMEDPSAIQGRLSTIVDRLEQVIVSSNTTLEFLPEVIAHRKARLMNRIKKMLEEGE